MKQPVTLGLSVTGLIQNQWLVSKYQSSLCTIDYHHIAWGAMQSMTSNLSSVQW
jgi:hypothetical protein